jgi:hypothetical protein
MIWEETMKRTPKPLGPTVAALILIWRLSLCGSAEAAHIQVTTAQEGVTNGLCSLQEAIYSSEYQTNKAIDTSPPDHFYTTGCTPGSGSDTIELPAGAVFNFDFPWLDAHDVYGPAATPVIFSSIDIEGNGATLQWTGGAFRPQLGVARLFNVAGLNSVGGMGSFGPSVGPGSLTLRNLYIKGFSIKGGDGGSGAGGGLGAGGAIYVDNGGGVIVESSTFDSNGAIGGNGGAGSPFSLVVGAGGGGGVFGNGGDGCEAGGGGGGSRGNGGKSGCSVDADGGGGGGTVSDGGDADSNGGLGGILCGGGAGQVFGNQDAVTPSCPGGGGGGGGNKVESHFQHGNGASGSFGGGGGGGGGDGGSGGFGGGGGASGQFFLVGMAHAGNGGFGGGSGSASGYLFGGHPGKPGDFGGRADYRNGGGGGALGGAIFNNGGTVLVRNSTFSNNFVTRGAAGNGPPDGGADNGADAGGAIFSYAGSLEIMDATISGNQSTGSGGGVVIFVDPPSEGQVPPVSRFHLYDTIIANNGANECFLKGPVTFAGGVGNLIMQNGVGVAPDGPFSPCPGVVSSSDPLLGPLQLNGPGDTPTMAIPSVSPAVNAADPNTSILVDQRGVTRPQLGGFDIGAFEARSPFGPP